MNEEIIYFDNGATSWPKPKEVVEAMNGYMTSIGASPGRSGHRKAFDAARIVFEARETIAEFFNIDDSRNVVFTANATQSLNMAIKGIVKDGDHIITSSMEHNSVVRPLTFLKENSSLDFSMIGNDPKGNFDIEQFKKAFTVKTKLVVVNHGSNVTGRIAPIAEIGRICREKGVLFLIDGAQSAGTVDIDMVRDNIDILAFTGHKSLFGPQGTGGLCINGDINIRPMLQGGSGSKSELDHHPEFMPDKLEAGTLNTVGIAGLLAGIEFINDIGLKNVINKEREMTKRLFEGLSQIKNVIVYGTDLDDKLPVISFNIKGMRPSDVGYELDKDYHIMTRVGLHCAPHAHRTIGTFPDGTVRLSLSYMNNMDQVETVVNAVREIAEKS